MSDLPSIQRFCLSLKGTTEDLKWGDYIVFSVAGKMYAVLTVEEGKAMISFKAGPEPFEMLTGRSGIIPAPYLARYYWVKLMNLNVMEPKELLEWVRGSYDLVFAKLPKKQRRAILEKG